MKISVIVTFFNSSNYVEKCMKSILEQTYTDVEIIMIDDGSVDDTSMLCKQYINSNCRLIQQSNSGVSVARNKGIEAATGDYIMFVDGDDSIPKNSIRCLVDGVSDNTDIVIGEYYECDENKCIEKNFFGKSVDVVEKNKLFLQLMDPHYAQENSMVFAAVGVPWGKLYRLNFLKEYKLTFDPALRRMQDNIFNMYAFYFAKKIDYINSPVYYYRIEHISKYTKPYNAQNLYLVLQSRKNFFENVWEKKKNKDIAMYYKKERVHLFIQILKNIILSNKIIKAKKEMKKYITLFSDTIAEKCYWKENKSDYIFYICIKRNWLIKLYMIYKGYVLIKKKKKK